jgi:hypothetical protein
MPTQPPAGTAVTKPQRRPRGMRIEGYDACSASCRFRPRNDRSEGLTAFIREPAENFTAQNRFRERLGLLNDGRAFSILGTEARLLISSRTSLPKIRRQNQ